MVESELNCESLNFEMDYLVKNNVNVMKLFEDEKRMVKICAPMVRYSKLQFRNLVKIYNCDLCFTPMILADSFWKSEKARSNEFSTNFEDSPVIVQFAANDIEDFVSASVLASPYCNGVDLNCGCPQRWAKQLGLGCVLLENPQKIYDITRACRNRIPQPFTISVKTRIFSDLRRTVDACRKIQAAGVSFLTIHARTPNENTGGIHEESLKIIKENLDIPLIANGGIKSLNDALELRERVNCDGVMVANKILENPTIFSGQNVTSFECVQNWLDLCYNSTIPPEKYSVHYPKTINERPINLTFQCFHHHLVFMLEKIMSKKQRKFFNNLKKFEDVIAFLRQEFNIIPRLFPREKFMRYTPLKLNSIEDKDEVDDEEKEREEKGKYFAMKINNSNAVDDEAEEECECEFSQMFQEPLESK